MQPFGLVLSSYISFFFTIIMPAYIWILVTFTVFIIGFLLGIPFGHYMLSDFSRFNFEYLNSAGTWAGSLATTCAVVVSLYYGYHENKVRQPSIRVNFVSLGEIIFINIVNTSPSPLYFHSALFRSKERIIPLTFDILPIEESLCLVPGQYYSYTLYAGELQEYMRGYNFIPSLSTTFEFRTTIPATGSVVHLNNDDILALTR